MKPTVRPKNRRRMASTAETIPTDHNGTGGQSQMATPGITPVRLLPQGQPGTWIAQSQAMWQLKFVDHDGLARFSSERGVQLNGAAVGLLWQMGLLQADLIISSRKIRRVGLRYLGRNANGHHQYTDCRMVPKRKKGWLSAAQGLKPLPKFVELRFHPFRYFVLFHLHRVLDLPVSPLQPLIGAEFFPRLLERVLTAFNKWSQTEEFRSRITEWNEISAIAVASEPCEYVGIFGSLSIPVYLSTEEQLRKIEEYRNALVPVFESIGLDNIKAKIQELCISGQRLDPNRDIQTMLRLARKKTLLTLEGRLGGALVLRTMAEMLRRFSERTWSVSLPEEDELGFGWFPPDLKQRLYGAKRLLDGSRNAVSEFMRRFQLDFGTRLRWYVEGQTEFGALNTIFGKFSRSEVEVINLRGKVVQKDHVAFRDSLRSDVKSQIFSFVSVDGDRADVIRVLRRAAEDDEICGRFFISYPDFEMANFELYELEEILWDWAAENGASQSDRGVLHSALKGVTTGSMLLSRAKKALQALSSVDKGEAWGEALVKYALNHPTWKTGVYRPFLEAVQVASRVGSFNYQSTRRDLRVDPRTGELVPRSTPLADF